MPLVIKAYDQSMQGNNGEATLLLKEPCRSKVTLAYNNASAAFTTDFIQVQATPGSGPFKLAFSAAGATPVIGDLADEFTYQEGVVYSFAVPIGGKLFVNT